MRQLSDTPKMAWSRPPMDIPFPLRHAILTSGYTQFELEDVAERLLDEYGDWKTAVEQIA